MRTLLAAALVLTTLPALACDPAQHRDLVRAEQRQADTLKQMERTQRDQALQADRQWRIDNRNR